MDNIKANLTEVIKRLEELEATARKEFQNKNLADVIASARGKLVSAADHPDLPLLQEKVHGPDQSQLDYAGERLPEGQSRDSTYETAYQGGPAIQPVPQVGAVPPFPVGEPPAYKPGEPKFEPANPDFKNPNAVDLNRDGTLQQAPNSIGAPPDVRK